MRSAMRLLAVGLLLSLATWAQSGSAAAPKSRKAHAAGVHKMQPHAARRLTVQEKQEHARMNAEQRRQAKLAKKQRQDAMRRSRRLRKQHPIPQ